MDEKRTVDAILVTPEFRDSLIEYLKKKPYEEVAGFLPNLITAQVSKVTFNNGPEQGKEN